MDFHPEIFARIRERIIKLSTYSEEKEAITRPFMAPSMRPVVEEVGTWAKTIQLESRVDALGNVIVRSETRRPDAKTLVLGSHLNTVRNAGKYDGILGVTLAMAVLEQIHEWQLDLPFHLEVVGFSDEKQTRYPTAYLSSSFYAGLFDPTWLQLVDPDGISLTQVLQAWGSDPEQVMTEQRKRDDLLGYAEVHIEQGSLLEQEGRAIGLVDTICGQTHVAIEIEGQAEHAGTTPMDSRRDALALAATFIVEVEEIARQFNDMVATVGELNIEPNTSDVIPGLAHLSLDVRHPDNETRINTIQSLRATLQNLCERRGFQHTWSVKRHTPTANCDEELSQQLREAAHIFEGTLPELVSGAEHNAVIMSKVCPICMLFVQAKQGLSQHPDEFTRTEHIETAFRTMLEFIRRLADQHA